MGGGHGTQNVKAGRSAQDGGRAHTSLRPEFMGSTEPLLGPRVPPPPDRLESLGALSQLCVKAETWLLGGDSVQGTELACRLGMASNFRGFGKGVPSRNNFPFALLN